METTWLDLIGLASVKPAPGEGSCNLTERGGGKKVGWLAGGWAGWLAAMIS